VGTQKLTTEMELAFLTAGQAQLGVLAPSLTPPNLTFSSVGRDRQTDDACYTVARDKGEGGSGISREDEDDASSVRSGLGVQGCAGRRGRGCFE
jgi:hypothetical protein